MTQAVADQVLAPSAGTWEIDPTHSAITFEVRHLMISRVRGRFAGFSGVLNVGDTPEESSVEVAIDAASIETDLVERDEHLRSPDFLAVEEYPTISFRSTRVERTAEDGLRVGGELTIRDVTRPVTLDATYLGAVADPWGGTRAGFTAETEIDREDFGVTWNMALEAGGFLVGKKLRVQLEVEAIKRADQQQEAA